MLLIHVYLVWHEEDPESYYETLLLATKLRVEEDPRLQWSYYYLLFPLNQTLDNRFLSEKDNEGKHLDLEVMLNCYTKDGFDFFSGVCKSRIAVSGGATRYRRETKTLPTSACNTN